MPKNTNTPEVIIVWTPSLDDAKQGHVNVLTHGNGRARIYTRDVLDARLTLDGETPPYCRDVQAATDLWVTQADAEGRLGSQHAVQLDVRAAVLAGLI